MFKNQLYRFAIRGALAAALALCGAAGIAQNAPPPDASSQQPAGAPGFHGRRGPMNPDAALARMTKRYHLSAAQQSQIKPLLQSRMQQMEALRGDSSLSREDRRTKMMSIRQDTRTRIEGLLNDKQKQKFDADEQRMEQRMQRRMQGGGPPAPPNGGSPQQ